MRMGIHTVDHNMGMGYTLLTTGEHNMGMGYTL